VLGVRVSERKYDMAALQAERRLAAQIAAHESWAHTPDRAARTAPARAALDAKFENQVDPDGILAPDERAKRAAHARRAHYQRLALKSAKARRQSRELSAVARSADVELRTLEAVIANGDRITNVL